MKKIILISTIICTIIATYNGFFLCAKAQDLKLFENHGRYGYVNQKGELVLNTQFDEANEFYEGLAAVNLYGKWGFINKRGKFIIQPQYNRVGDFHEGRAYVVHLKEEYRDGSTYVTSNVAYIDRHGKIVIPYYESGLYFYDFSSGLTAKQYGDSTYCSYMDKNGNLVLDKNYFEQKGWINTRDAVCNGFQEGLLNVYKYTDDTYKTRISAYMNKKGEIVYNRKFNVPEDEEEGSCDFDSFSEGMARFRVNWKYGFINKDFNEVIPPIYDFAYEFQDGLARVEKDEKWFYIDKNGNFVKEYIPNY